MEPDILSFLQTLNQRHLESFGVLQNTSAVYYMRLPYLRCSLRFLWCKILTNHPKPMLTMSVTETDLGKRTRAKTTTQGGGW